LAEEVYPDYRVSQTISSLGRPGPSAIVFNSSLFLEGILVLVAAHFLHKAYHRIPVMFFFALGGLGAIGGALFPEDVYNVHLAISIFAAAVILAIPQIFYPLGLPYGAVERIVAYPTLLWVIGFGSQIMSRNLQETNIHSP
jgi:hypothetical membrane protein